MSITVTSSASGPVFDGRAHAAVKAFIEDAEETIAQHGVNVFRTELRGFLRRRTGYYESQVQTDRAGGDSVIHDGGVVYGPWLAGEGSRNSPVTRFPGYPHVRLTTQRLQAEAAPIAERVLPKYLRRME
ncbi:hypothetical protein [Nonomuraea bangladeshensis]|uniref:hypothetical protein n=1 Tax=Nonomuraea bangladeshensis TaxID=404385 RepID=UPI0031D5A474